ncbi:hypothetical protein [Sphingomonas sp.]|uniref:hypothetical protein n=1 Tax=Sphingomonas sp. TaxID=28214 RepID=UPI002CA179AB|nr:hypothetical protein [Sphingomonas sp.]HTG38282.1 hypothetical protein [Sphingomonas sp.]
MRGQRLILEIFYTVAGLAGAWLIGAAAAWAYPVGRANVWLVTWVSMGIIVLMGIPPMLRAARGGLHD